MENENFENNPMVPMQNFWTRLSWPKRVLVVVAGLVGIAFVMSMGMGSLSGTASHPAWDSVESSRGLSVPLSADKSQGLSMEMDYSDSAYTSNQSQNHGNSVGSYDESAYEKRSYSAQIKTADMDEKCDAIEVWKPFSYVIFESANRGDTRCRYSFKVERAYSATILAELEKLDPDNLIANTQVMKQQLIKHSSQLDVLLQQQELLESTLENAVFAYDELVALSKDARDVESLSKVIDSKLAHIERLSRERISLSARIDNLARSTSQLTDSIEYVHFDVQVDKYQIFDGNRMKDSWVASMRQFVNNLNSILQDLSIGLIGNLLTLAQILVYAVVYLS